MNGNDVSNIDSSKKDESRERVKRGFYFIVGTGCLILGGVGVLLPVLPTTPFLLLSSACYYKSSKRMHRWMLTNQWFGKYLKNYAEGKGISLKAKFFIISLLWILIIYSIFVVNNLLIQLTLFAIAIGVTIHLIKLPTLRETWNA
jgi:uncharacterized membrane protein YbaN (DUF454 family)